MERLVRIIANVLYLLAFSALLASCYTYKEVFNDKYYVEEDKPGALAEKLEVGDRIFVRVNGKDFTNLLVTGVKDQTLSVVWYNEGMKRYHTIYIPYIQKLEVQITDPMYTLGAGYSSLLILFFLLI